MVKINLKLGQDNLNSLKKICTAIVSMLHTANSTDLLTLCSQVAKCEDGYLADIDYSAIKAVLNIVYNCEWIDNRGEVLDMLDILDVCYNPDINKFMDMFMSHDHVIVLDFINSLKKHDNEAILLTMLKYWLSQEGCYAIKACAWDLCKHSIPEMVIDICDYMMNNINPKCNDYRSDAEKIISRIKEL